MGKHFDLETKNKIVSEYFNNQGGVKVLSKKYDISYHTIQNWIDKQNRQGNQLNDIHHTRGRKIEESINYKERYEILKKYQAFLKAQREKK